MDRAQYLAIRKNLNLSHNRWALPLHLFQNALLICAVAVLASIYAHSLVRFAAIPLFAVLIFRNFSMMHEAVHRAVSKNANLNDAIGVIAGGICGLPFEPWRKSHLEHHTWGGNIDRDPVMALVNVYPKFQAKTKSLLSFFWNVWFPILACMQYTVFYWLASKIYLKNPRSTKLLISLAAPIAIWGLVFTLCPIAFSLQIAIPAILTYLVAVEVVNFPHHLQLPQYRGETKLPFWEQYKIARSCIYPRWMARFAALNFNYHSEHHMFPDVPWYHLEALQTEVRRLLPVEAYNSDPNFQWILHNKPFQLDQVLITRNSQDSAPKKATPAA